MSCCLGKRTTTTCETSNQRKSQTESKSLVLSPTLRFHSISYFQQLYNNKSDIDSVNSMNNLSNMNNLNQMNMNPMMNMNDLNNLNNLYVVNSLANDLNNLNSKEMENESTVGNIENIGYLGKYGNYSLCPTDYFGLFKSSFGAIMIIDLKSNGNDSKEEIVSVEEKDLVVIVLLVVILKCLIIVVFRQLNYRLIKLAMIVQLQIWLVLLVI